MTFEEFLSNNFAEIIGLLFIAFILTKENIMNKEDVQKFMDIFFCECVELFAFNLEKMTGYWGEPTTLRILLSALCYVLRALLVYLFVRYLWPHDNNKNAKILLSIPLFLCVLCGLSPFFTDVVYSFTADNHFVRGPLGWIFVTVVIFYVLLFVYYIIRQSEKHEKSDTAILLLIAFFIIASTIMSTFYDIEWMGRLSIVYGMVFCLFELYADKLKSTIFALKENETLKVVLNELEMTKKAAESANRSKSEFLLRMSHDIRTPINGIMGMLEISERFENDIEKRDECREKIKNSSGILLELINEVLDMSKLESGEIILEHVSFNLKDVSEEVFYSIKKQADDKGIEIIQEDCHVGENRLVGSAIHLKRIMMNILSNAIKYNKDHGKIYITCRETKSDEKTVQLEFKCRDTGIGMSPEFLQHIFEPFTQENTGYRTKYAGTGLGMSIVKKLVDKMGGTINVESIKDMGTTFDVYLPFEIDTSSPEEGEKKALVETPSIAGMKILLAEDNELNMEIASFFLKDEGADVKEVENGQEALEAFENASPGTFDAILMDVMMPVLDGYDATRKIRSLGREDAKTIPIIAMTANAFAEDKKASREAGMNAHLSKPLDMKAVVRTLAAYKRK